MMSISTSICLVVFLGLFLASVVLQSMRAKKRQQLVRMVVPAMLTPSDQSRWHSVEKSFDFMFKDFRKLQILKRHSQDLSSEIRAELVHYRRFSRLELFVTASMLIFGSIAFLICN
jgi:hypothetical protein